MELIYFILIAFGLTQILTSGRIFNKIRPKYYYFTCSMCVGFVVGVFLLVISPYTELFTFERSWINTFGFGCLSSGTSYVLDTLFGDKGMRIENNRSQT